MYDTDDWCAYCYYIAKTKGSGSNFSPNQSLSEQGLVSPIRVSTTYSSHNTPVVDGGGSLDNASLANQSLVTMSPSVDGKSLARRRISNRIEEERKMFRSMHGTVEGMFNTSAPASATSPSKAPGTLYCCYTRMTC